MRYSKKQWVMTFIFLLLGQVAFSQDFPKISSKETKKINSKEIQFVTANGLKAVVAPKDETSLSLSENLKIKHKNFLTFNEMLPSMVLLEGKIYYLEAKKKAASVEFHTTQDRETLWDISQKYGVRLSNLMSFNRMSAAEQPQTGRVIWLSKKRPSSVPVEIKKLPPPVLDAKAAVDTAKVALVKTPPAEYYMTQEGQTISQIAQKNGLTEDSLYRLNPYISRTTPPTPGTILRVRPAMTSEQMSQLVNTVEAQKDTSFSARFSVNLDSMKFTKPGRKSHLVLSGETLQSVARMYRLSAGDLVMWNDLQESTLKPGQVLFLEAESQFKMPTREEVIAALDSGKHIVLPGQTIKSISSDYGISEKDLLEWNKLGKNPSLKPGQRLYIDAGFVPVSLVVDQKSQNGKVITEQNQTNSTGQPKYHTVVAGEGLWSVARKNGASVADVKAWNNLKDNEIKVGQKLIVGYDGSPSSVVVTQPSPKPNFKMPTQAEIDAAFGEGQHIVLPNENPTSIASKYNVKVDVFCKWNNITPSTELVPGQRLYYDADAIPAKEATNTNTTQAIRPSTSNQIVQVTKNQPIQGGFEPVFHKVASGDGLWSLSKKYKTTTVEIKRWNSLPDDQIKIGQQIVVGTKATKPQQHVVVSGEDLSSIAAKYSLPEGWLLYLNGGTPALSPGSSVKIK
jgi:membrane-bound lytic murein transglycosylase D